MASRKNSASIYVLAFALFAGAVGYLCFSGLTENSVYFLNVSEARAAAPEHLAQARLFGTVAGPEIEQEMNSVVFRLADKDDPQQTISVAYKGVVPDTFKPGAEVIVEGGLAADGVFSARTLMTKCPSKYQKQNRKI